MSKLIEQIHKKFGKDSYVSGVSDDAAYRKVGRHPSGVIKLDEILGGGYPVGRIIEIYGAESSGKTTLVLQGIAEIQKNGGKVVFIDMEHALDLDYAAYLGVDTSEMGFAQPENGEQALDLAEMILDSGEYDAIVIDSVAALVPKAEIEGDMGDNKMGLQARLMSQAMRKLSPKVGKSKCNIFFINQTRDKIGVMFGSPETTSGGNALKFYSSVRLRVRRATSLKAKDSNGEDVFYGHVLKIETVKNKVFPPRKTVSVKLIYGEGVEIVQQVFDLAVEKDLIKKSGSWYSYGDTKLGQGEANALALLKDNLELVAEIRKKL